MTSATNYQDSFDLPLPCLDSTTAQMEYEVDDYVWGSGRSNDWWTFNDTAISYSWDFFVRPLSYSYEQIDIDLNTPSKADTSTTYHSDVFQMKGRRIEELRDPVYAVRYYEIIAYSCEADCGADCEYDFENSELL